MKNHFRSRETKTLKGKSRTTIQLFYTTTSSLRNSSNKIRDYIFLLRDFYFNHSNKNAWEPMCKIFILYDFNDTYHLSHIDAKNMLIKATVDICKLYSSSCYPTCLLTTKMYIIHFIYNKGKFISNYKPKWNQSSKHVILRI